MKRSAQPSALLANKLESTWKCAKCVERRQRVYGATPPCYESYPKTLNIQLKAKRLQKPSKRKYQRYIIIRHYMYNKELHILTLSVTCCPLLL